jgi:hypothetical protein
MVIESLKDAGGGNPPMEPARCSINAIIAISD